MRLSSSKLFSRYLPLTFSVLLLVGAGLVFLFFKNDLKPADAAWYSSSWTYRKPITIDKNKVSGVATSTHYSFPMLFSVTDTDLKYTSHGGKVASTTGADILFTSSDGTTKLSHEIERYSSSTGETIIWVNIPLLSASSDTTIYIYFGNSGASDQQDASNVWDSNYKGVWHLGTDPTTSVSDSSANSKTLTNGSALTSADSLSAKIGNGVNYDAGVGDYLYRADDSDLEGLSALTISTWFKLDDTSSTRILANKGEVVYKFRTNGAKLQAYFSGGTTVTHDTTLSTNTWYYGTVTYDGTTLAVYLNGGTPKTGSLSGTLNTDTQQFRLGQQYDAVSKLDGIMDEARFSNIARSSDWIKTEYNNQTSPATFYAYGSTQIERVVNFPSLTAPAGPSWYNSSWTYRKPITIDKNKLSATATTTFSSFPMLFSVTDTDLKYTSHGGKVASTTGADILFTSSDGTTKLSHEIERYSSSTGETIIWVNIPLLSASSDTTIYIYFGNSGASDQQDVSNVWDGNYKMVQHLPNGTTLTANDSTSNSNNGSLVNSPIAVNGKIGGAASLNGTDQTITVNSQSSLDTNSAQSVSIWIRPNSVPQSSFATILNRKNDAAPPYNSWSLETGTGGNIYEYCIADSAGTGPYFGQYCLSYGNLTTSWHLFTGTYDGTTQRMYVDGVFATSQPVSITIDNDVNAVRFGSFNSALQFFNGYVDEGRLSNTARSADWIKTEYNNQTSPATFYAYGSLGTERSSTNRVKDRGASGLSWYSSSWTYRKPITIDKNKLSTTATTTFSSFPMLFSVTDTDLKYTSHGGKVASTTGADILFTSSDGTTKLSHEIEKYSSSTGETIIWVKIPLLSAASDTTIYIYFGNSGASDQQDVSNVWETNYKGVWHLPNGTTLTALDSTGNNNDGTLLNTPTATAGKVDGAMNLGSPNTNKSVGVGNNSSLNVGDVFTIEAWINPADITTSRHGIYTLRSANSTGSWQLEVSDGGAILGNNSVNTVALSGPSTWMAVGPDNAVTVNTWNHLVAVKNAGIPTLYVNGSAVANQMSAAFTAQNNADTKYIGEGTSRVHLFPGLIDEVRISASARTADWIKTEYNNQTSPSTFYSYGALGASSRQDSSGGSTPTVKVRGGVKFR